MDYIHHLKKDAKLAPIINGTVHERIKPHKNIPVHLIASIMSQQLNTKVADIIYKRFLALYNNKLPKTKQVMDTPAETLRSIGLSNAEVKYVHNVAAFCTEHKITDKKLHALSNDEIEALLTQIKGVGKWTTEMLMMFALGREDIFSADDLGIQQAMIKLYGLKAKDKKKLRTRMIKIAETWSPYRTYACLYLWGWKDAGG